MALYHSSVIGFIEEIVGRLRTYFEEGKLREKLG